MRQMAIDSLARHFPCVQDVVDQMWCCTFSGFLKVEYITSKVLQAVETVQ